MINALLQENWTVTHFKETEDSVTLYATYDLMPEVCLRCGAINPKFHRRSVEPTRYAEAPIYGLKTTLEVAVVRLECLECHQTFMQPIPGITPRRRLTDRCIRYIEREVVTETYAKITTLVNVTEKTVRSIERAAATKREKNHIEFSPLVLGIDELRLHGKLRTIFTDVAERRVLDILPSREPSLVAQWLSWRPNRDRIQIVTMDMHAPYRDAVKGVLPGVTIIADRWHVQKAINKALDAVRVRFSRQQRTKKARLYVLRKRLLLQASRHRLRPHVHAMLMAWLVNNPLLRDAWETKEALYDVWDSQNAEEARRRFQEVRDRIPASVQEEFGDAGFCGTVDRWGPQIFPFFDLRYTNAYTEAANGIIKIANRAGRGYHFNQIRRRALAQAARPKRGPPMYVCEVCTRRFPMEPGMISDFGVSYCAEHAVPIWRRMGVEFGTTPKVG